MADLPRIIITSALNKAALETALNVIFPGGIPGGGMANFTIGLTHSNTQVPPATWFGGSGWYPDTLINALLSLPLLCEVYTTDGTRASFTSRIAIHLPQLFFVQYPEEL